MDGELLEARFCLVLLDILSAYLRALNIVDPQ